MKKIIGIMCMCSIFLANFNVSVMASSEVIYLDSENSSCVNTLTQLDNELQYEFSVLNERSIAGGRSTSIRWQAQEGINLEDYIDIEIWKDSALYTDTNVSITGNSMTFVTVGKKYNGTFLIKMRLRQEAPEVSLTAQYGWMLYDNFPLFIVDNSIVSSGTKMITGRAYRLLQNCDIIIQKNLPEKKVMIKSKINKITDENGIFKIKVDLTKMSGNEKLEIYIDTNDDKLGRHVFARKFIFVKNPKKVTLLTSKITSKTKAIRGKTSANCKVQLLVKKRIVASARSGYNGTFSLIVNLKKYKPGTQLKFVSLRTVEKVTTKSKSCIVKMK